MNGTSFERLKQIFNTAIELPVDERAAYLGAQGDIDHHTRRQLEDLLRADAGATRRASVDDAKQARLGDWSGRRIGAYRVERTLGHGGMGSVFLAHRADGNVEQKVAIKVVRPERSDAVTLARFRLERQVLALLQHPNIAPMLDLGELPDGSPYVVMAYVEGVTIDRYIDERHLDLTACLRLFLQICDAVAYAHRNLIVHRDLKPGNVLVDGDGRPQLLDFGIAKPLQSQIGAIDIQQTDAEQRFLSLSHAAPEQLAGEAVTTACDVYGLGALLYQLLSGTPPLQRAGQTPAQLVHRILNEDPPPPSQAGGGAAPRLRFRRDLDVIVLRCLRKRPGDRYASVEQLADDIRRYLDDRPVLARRGNVLYRATRFLARHRVAASLAGVLVAAGAIGGTLFLRQQSALTQEQQRADEMTGLITDALRFVDPANARGRDVSAREVFERVAAQAQASPTLSPASRAHILGSIAQIDLSLGLPSEAQTLLAKLDTSALAGDRRDALALLHARTLVATSRQDEARAAADRGLAATAAGTDDRREWQLLDARIDLNQGDNHGALAKLERLAQENWPPVLSEDRDSLHADVLWQFGRAEEAIVIIRRTLAQQRQRFGASSPMIFDALLRAARREVGVGNYDAAEALRSELVAMTDRYFSRTSMRYAGVLSLGGYIETRRGNIDKAIDYITQSQRLYIDHLGENTNGVATEHLNLASLNEERGNHEEAARHYLAALAIGERIWPPTHPNLLLFRTATSNYLALRDRCAEAYPIAKRSLVDMYENPGLAEYDAGLLTVAVADYCLLREHDSPGQRAAVASDLHRAVTQAETPDVKNAAEQLAEKAKEVGVVVPK
jgi:serine/threonine protein kinase